MRCLYTLLVVVAFAAGAALRPESGDRLSELEAKNILDRDVEAAESELKDVVVTADRGEKLERDFYDPYSSYYNPYNSYNPYGGFGGYPFYPPFFSQPSSSSANAVAVSNGGGFFGGNSNANAVAVSGGRRRRDVEVDDLLALLDKDADTKSDVVERGFGYGGYPYGGFGGYPYGGFGGYPYPPPFFGGYPGLFGGGGSTSANSVAVANGNGFFGGDSTANSIAVANGVGR